MKRNSDAFLVKDMYETPVVNVVEIASEGVLCASGQCEEWGEEDLQW